MYKAMYWFFQWLKWCSCCGGHYAGRVDFGIDFNVSLTHITLYLPCPKAMSNVCLREKEWTSGFVLLILCRTTLCRFDWQLQQTGNRSSGVVSRAVLQQYLCQLAFSFQIQCSSYTKPFLLQCWSISGFFNNCTFMFCRCRCHSNVMTNQEDIIH